MSVITLVPEDNLIVIDGEVANDVNFSGINPTIHSVSWYDTQGVIEYNGNPITGEKPLNEIITELTPFQSYVTEAQNILYAQNNPVTYYSTSSALSYGDGVYGLGDAVVVTAVGWPQPAQTTAKVPTTPEEWQSLYWYNNNWVVSSFNPTLSLAQAQQYLNLQIQISAAAAGADQARIYSPVQLFDAASVSDLPSADFFSVTLGQYQSYLDSEVASLTAQVNAATTTLQLYGFNPTVNPQP